MYPQNIVAKVFVQFPRVSDQTVSETIPSITLVLVLLDVWYLTSQSTARWVPDTPFLNHRETPQCECPWAPPRESRELWTQAVHGTPGGQEGPLSDVRAGPDVNLSRPTPGCGGGVSP